MKKCYVFVHRGVKGSYTGIQALHAAVRLVSQNQDHPDIKAWADEFETVVILDGGNSSNMRTIYSLLTFADNPSATFRETDMDNLVTAIAYVPSEVEYMDIENIKLNGIGNLSSSIVDVIANSKTHRG
ncbi:peptidyl-tRNA hydrolase [Aeromonas phage ZPAH1]|nr:hypothetical protein ASwh1_195 [Aeromonas phage Aswh_1]QQG34006.1 peptidyl-tRNA hydrolase [Aeromonas phage ZPAH1]